MTEIEKKLWVKALRYIKFLRFVPFLRMASVCNSLAFGWVDKNSDIDLFIVAKKGRLFLVRTLVTTILQILGVRRHGRKIAGRFCLSFFIDDSHLDLEPISIENDLYLAHWIVAMKPVIDDGVGEEFLHGNEWVKPFLNKDWQFEMDKSRAILNKSFLKQLFELIFDGVLGDFLECKLRIWQQNRALKKKSLLESSPGVIVADNILKFHNVERRPEYRARFR